MKGMSGKPFFGSAVFLCAFLFILSGSLTGAAWAEDKVYENKDVGFTIKHPSNWKADKLQTNDVLRVHKPNQWKVPVLNVTVVDRGKDVKLEDAAKNWVDAVKKANPGVSRVRITSKEMIKLSDGTPAAAYIIKWTWTDGMSKLFSTAVTAHAKNKVVTATATNVLGGETPADVLMNMCKTLTFKK